MNVRDLYPQSNSDYFSVYSYQPMIDSFGNVLIQVDDRDYQGDTRVLLQDANGFIGFLVFGWGSCSGCDALQGCSDFDDLQRLYDSLKNGVQWWESAEDALRWFEKHDWEGDYSWHQEETHEFVKRCKDLLAMKVAEKHLYSCPSLDGIDQPCTCEQNPADCGKTDSCHKPGGCFCPDVDDYPEYNEQLDHTGSYVDNTPTETLGRELVQTNNKLVVEQPYQTYVWENVCCDYTPGIVVVVARSVKEALEMVEQEDSRAYDEVKDIDPIVCGTRLRVFIVKGGS